MKTSIFSIIIISFIATSFHSSPNIQSNLSFEKKNLSIDKYKACIEACNACILSCKNCEKSCAANKVKMAKCIQLCQENVAICNAAVQLMTLNSDNAKELCVICAKVCDKCAIECDKYPTMKDCKDCATACRKAAKMCKEMK